ncbi:MAG: hypothetical protein J6X28_05345, partial [Bacilli bacterium]|nr:hypothetical protein [Bacilli bacterium]
MKIQFESLPPKTIEEGGRILFHYFRAIVRGRNQFKPTYRYRDFVVYLIGVFLFILLIALIGMIFIEKETPSIVFINLA